MNREHAAWQEESLAAAEHHHDVSSRDLGHGRGHEPPPDEQDGLKKLLGMSQPRVDFECPNYKFAGECARSATLRQPPTACSLLPPHSQSTLLWVTCRWMRFCPLTR